MKRSAKMLRVVVILASIVMTFVSLNFFPAPFIWIFALWFIVFQYAAMSSMKSRTRLLLFFYVSFIFFIFGIYETYLWMTKKNFPRLNEEYTKGVVIRGNDILGYAPRRNTTASHAKYYKDKLIFKVLYTTDSNGLRVSPPCNLVENKACVLFFGCSLTFGTGVKDKETMPYLTGIKTHGRYRVYNFAFRGYGPHQMLSAIEHGMVESIIKGKPKYAIYKAFIGHIARAAGLKNWNKYGPRYILKEDGKVIFDGHFDYIKRKNPAKKRKKNPKKRTLLKKVVSELKKSLIFKKIVQKKKGFHSNHVNLFIEIVNASRHILETRYPGCRFHVIFWDDKKHPNNTEVLEKLNKKGIRVHLLSDILPDFDIDSRRSKYRIDIYERHPSSLAYEKIAGYVADKIIGNEEHGACKKFLEGVTTNE